MADLVVRELSQAGSSPAPVAAAAGGDQFVAGPRTFIRVTNGGGSTITVTIPRAKPSVNLSGSGDVPVNDIVVQLLTTVIKDIIVPPETHAPGGIARVTYSGVTSVTIEAMRLPQV